MIKIIQLADWHIQEDLNEEKNIAQELFKAVDGQIEKTDTVIVCICGDIVF